MANETHDILLRLKLEGDADLKKRNNELLVSIQKNKEAIEQNNKALKEFKSAGDTTSQAVNDLKLKNIELTNSNKALGSELQNNIKQITSEVGALNEKRAMLSNMNAAYARLSEDAKRNTAEGIAQGAAIRKLSDDLEKEEKALGNAHRGVGKYTEAIIEANNQTGLGSTVLGKAITGYKAFKVAALEASGGTSVLNGALKLLMTNPVFAIIAVIAGIFMLLKEAIGKNASIVGEFTRALAPFQIIIGAVLGVVSDFVKLLVGGFSAAMKFITSLFGEAGAAANEYVATLAAAAAAEKELFNLRIRQKEQQKEINNLMAVANNRMVDGKARYEAITKAIEIELETARKQAKESETIFQGTIARLETEYDLRGQLMNNDMTLTKEANKKLSQEDKDLYVSKLEQRIEFDEKESELRKTSGRKLGQIQKAVVAQEKELRDLGIAAMADGLGKQLKTIESNYTAQKQTLNISFKEQRKALEVALKQQMELYKDNYAMIAKLSVQFYQDIMTVNKQQSEQEKLIAAAEAREKQTAQRNAAKAAGDSRIAIERQIQDSYLTTIQDGFYKEQQAALLAYQRKREDLKREADFSGKNKKETNALISALDRDYNETSKKAEEKHQQELTYIISGKYLDRKTKEIELRLATVRDGSKAELDLRLQQINLQRDSEIREAEKLGEDILLIKDKYAKAEFDLKQKYERDAQSKVLAEIQQGYVNQIEAARQKGEDTFNLQINAKQREINQLTLLDGETNEQFVARKLKLEADLTEIQLKQSDERGRIREVEFKTAQIIADGFGALADMISETGERNATFAKALALFTIVINQGIAISNAVASAKGLTGFDYILQVATGITAALVGIAQARKVLLGAGAVPKAQGKAQGGLIRGAGSGTSDSVPINASNNESVLTAQSTGMFAPLLSGLNIAGGGVAIQSVNKSQEVMGEQFLANAFSKALTGLPPQYIAIDEYRKADAKYVEITQNAIK